MICKKAVQEFMKRELRNSDKAKQFSSKAIDAKLAALDPKPKFVLEPRHHQKVSFLLGLKYSSYGLLLDPGLGKTKVVLDLFMYRKRLGQVNRLLVLVPNVSNLESWAEQCRLHAPDLAVETLDGSKTEKQNILLGESDVVVVTYMGWLHIVCELTPNKKTQKRKMLISEKKAKLAESQFDMVAYDESSVLGNPQSVSFRTARRLAKAMHFRYILTGTPFGRDPSPLWSQFFLVDHGEALGDTLGLFRTAFFEEKDDYWSGGKIYTFDERKKPLLSRALRHSSIRYAEWECNDLPPRTYIKCPVVFSEEISSYYEKLVRELKEAEGNFKLLENVFVRLRQLASGFLVVKDPEGERVEIVFKENPKLETFLDKIEEIPPERKVIVFHEYLKTGEILSDALKKLKVKHLRLYSQVADKRGVVRRFTEDPSVRMLVSTQAGAYGLNLQVANYVHFFETPVDPRVRSQEEKRADRTGQTRHVFIYDYFVKGSIEEKILKYLKEGRNLFEELVERKTWDSTSKHSSSSKTSRSLPRERM